MRNYEIFLDDNRIKFPIELIEDMKVTVFGARYFLLKREDTECGTIKFVEVRNNALVSLFNDDKEDCDELIAEGTAEISADGFWTLPEAVLEHLQPDSHLQIEESKNCIYLVSHAMYKEMEKSNAEFVQQYLDTIAKIAEDDEKLDKIIDDEDSLERLLDLLNPFLE